MDLAKLLEVLKEVRAIVDGLNAMGMNSSDLHTLLKLAGLVP